MHTCSPTVFVAADVYLEKLCWRSSPFTWTERKEVWDNSASGGSQFCSLALVFKIFLFHVRTDPVLAMNIIRVSEKHSSYLRLNKEEEKV